MSLIDTADRKCRNNPFMASLDLVRIMFIKRASLLIHQNTVIMQGIIAYAVKFPGKMALRRTKRVHRIHNNQIVGIFAPPNKAQSIIKIDMHPLIVSLLAFSGRYKRQASTT